MDFLVSEPERSSLTTESVDDETYPGLTIYEMTDAQKQAVEVAKSVTKLTHHLSPVQSDDEEEEESDESEEEEESEDESISHLPDDEKIAEPVTVVQTVIQPITQPAVQETMPTPNIFAKLPDEKMVEELRQEVTQLRKKVAITVNMKSFMSRLNGTEDVSFQLEVIKSYSRRRFNIIITDDDFNALTQEQITAMYKKTRESEKSDKFELIYKTIFDFAVSSLEQILNKFFFKVNNLHEYLLYDDVSCELVDMKTAVEDTIVGKYVDHTSPIIRILSYTAIQVARAKLKV